MGGSGRRRTAEAAELAHATGSATQLCMRSGSMPFVNTSRDPPPLGLGPTDPRGFESRAPARTAARSTSSAAAAAACCAKLAKRFSSGDSLPGIPSSSVPSKRASVSACVSANRPVSSEMSGPHTSVTPAASATARAAGVRGE